MLPDMTEKGMATAVNVAKMRVKCYSYEKILNLPAGVEACAAADVLPWEEFAAAVYGRGQHIGVLAAYVIICAMERVDAAYYIWSIDGDSVWLRDVRDGTLDKLVQENMRRHSEDDPRGHLCGTMNARIDTRGDQRVQWRLWNSTLYFARQGEVSWPATPFRVMRGTPLLPWLRSTVYQLLFVEMREGYGCFMNALRDGFLHFGLQGGVLLPSAFSPLEPHHRSCVLKLPEHRSGYSVDTIARKSVCVNNFASSTCPPAAYRHLSWEALPAEVKKALDPLVTGSMSRVAPESFYAHLFQRFQWSKFKGSRTGGQACMRRP